MNMYVVVQVQLSELLLSGHSLGNRRWPIDVFVYLGYFHHWVIFLVNMVSLQDHHNKVLQCFYHNLFWTFLCCRTFQNKVNLGVLNFGWPFNMSRNNTKTLIEMTKR